MDASKLASSQVTPRPACSEDSAKPIVVIEGDVCRIYLTVHLGKEGTASEKSLH